MQVTEGGEIFREAVEVDSREAPQSRAPADEDVRVQDFDPFIMRGIG
jgi:hypothetical protein